MENHEVHLSNETELHYKVVDFIKRFKQDIILIPGLGENQKTTQTRSDSYFKGYEAGQVDILILNPHRYYQGLAIELKTPTGKNNVSNKQKEYLNKLENLSFKVIVSNDYDLIVVELLKYFRHVLYPCKHCLGRKYNSKEKLERHNKYFHKIN